MPKDFWVLPLLDQHKLDETTYVVYRKDGNEIPVKVKNGKLKTVKESLTPSEYRWFNKNVLIN